MNSIAEITLGSIHQSMGRLDKIANNIANISTPGFRREVQVASSQSPGHKVNKSFESYCSDVKIHHQECIRSSVMYSQTESTHLDLRQGALKATGRNLDLALLGDAYFEISTPDGPAYTRAGNFQVDSKGRLVTAQGWLVQGVNGEIQISSSETRFDGLGRIESTISDGSSSQRQSMSTSGLKLVRFPEGAVLTKMGHGLMQSNMGPQSISDSSVQVKQGFIEGSNVDTAQEMVGMLQTVRHVESMQKAFSQYDEMTAQAIRKLGELG